MIEATGQGGARFIGTRQPWESDIAQSASVDLGKELAELHFAFFQEVFRYCAFRLFSAELGEEAAAAVFLRLVEKYPSLRRRGREGVRRWLYGAANNYVARHVRELKRRRAAHARLGREQVQANKAEAAAADSSVPSRVQKALSLLGKKDQVVLFLRYREGLSNPEIATRIGVPVGTVRVRLFRAIRALRDRLGDTNDE